MRSHRTALAAVLAATAAIAASAQQPPPAPSQPALPQAAPMPSVLRDYKAVTAERLLKPEAGDWLMIRRTYDGWGFSPLAQITASNVKQLKPMWSFVTGQTSGHQSPPIVNGGVMFVSTPGDQVLALDAVSGRLLWRYRRPQREDLISLHRTNRGVALYGDRVFLATSDALLVAIDARTGKEAWSAKVAENRSGYYMSLAPLVADGKVMVGASGGELGIRGFVAAFDVETGKEAWRAFTVPAPGEPGSDTWPENDAWKTGGGPIWVTGNYDPDTHLAFWGTGNPGPWMGDRRPGDNLYTSSTIALDVRTGVLKGHHQYNPNDSWDWDEVSPPILVDFRRNGRTVKGLIDVARDGYMWFLERTDGRINFVDAHPFVKQNVFTSIDPKTGYPTVDPARKPGTNKSAEFCPSLWGGKDWPPVAFSPETRMIYVPANENLCSTIVGRPVEYSAGRPFTGAVSTMTLAPGADHVGEVQAWNVDTGKRVWTHTFAQSPNWGPMLATGGGLVFSGGTNDRRFRAFDAKTGAVLWEFPTSSGIIAPASTYTVNGKQYVAVQSGWGVDSRSMQARLDSLVPGAYPEVPEGGTVWVFAIEP